MHDTLKVSSCRYSRPSRGGYSGSQGRPSVRAGRKWREASLLASLRPRLSIGGDSEIDVKRRGGRKCAHLVDLGRGQFETRDSGRCEKGRNDFMALSRSEDLICCLYSDQISIIFERRYCAYFDLEKAAFLLLTLQLFSLRRLARPKHRTCSLKRAHIRQWSQRAKY